MNFDENWLAYRIANMRFAEVDYHLVLLPSLLCNLIAGPGFARGFMTNELANMTPSLKATPSRAALRSRCRG
ncbi:hypothetical protein EI94DRAFT_1720989 [Lactarius quietus]|nr:hypothetical protein EI94DRAFT_1720989 [Lactarius quietus]